MNVRGAIYTDDTVIQNVNIFTDVDDCYTFTAEDVSLVGSGNSWEYQCESHPFNVYTGGNNVDYPGCGNCTCCKLKGILMIQ